MKRCVARIDIGAERYFLMSLFPCKWTTFISSALSFESIKDAREKMNYRQYQIAGSVGNNDELVKRIIIDSYEDGKLVQTVNYIEYQ